MSRSRRINLNKDQEKEIAEAFNVFDVDQSDSMDPTELRDALRALGFDVTKAEVEKIMIKIDPTNIGSINFQQFRDVCAEFFQTRNPHIEILRAFALFDTDHDGFIDKDDLAKIAKELGDELTDEELTIMIEKFDKDHDGRINKEEFFNIMDPTNSAH